MYLVWHSVWENSAVVVGALALFDLCMVKMKYCIKITVEQRSSSHGG